MGIRSNLERLFNRLLKNKMRDAAAAILAVVVGMSLTPVSQLALEPFGFWFAAFGFVWIGIGTLMYVVFAARLIVKGVRRLGDD